MDNNELKSNEVETTEVENPAKNKSLPAILLIMGFVLFGILIILGIGLYWVKLLS